MVKKKKLKQTEIPYRLSMCEKDSVLVCPCAVQSRIFFLQSSSQSTDGFVVWGVGSGSVPGGSTELILQQVSLLVPCVGALCVYSAFCH